MSGAASGDRNCQRCACATGSFYHGATAASGTLAQPEGMHRLPSSELSGAHPLGLPLAQRPTGGMLLVLLEAPA